MLNKNLKIKRMKQLTNKTTEIDGTFEGESEQRKATYADLLRIAMMGITPDNNFGTQRKDFRVLDVLDKAIAEKSGTIELEDGDFAHLTARIKTVNWGFKNRGLLQLEDDLNKVNLSLSDN